MCAFACADTGNVGEDWKERRGWQNVGPTGAPVGAPGGGDPPEKPAAGGAPGGGEPPPDGAPQPGAPSYGGTQHATPEYGAQSHHTSAPDPALGTGYYPPQVEAFYEKPRKRAAALPIATVALICGLAGLVLGPFLVSDGVGRYAVLAADIAALGLGGFGIYAAVRTFTKFGNAIAAIVAGSLGLALWISYMSSPPVSSCGASGGILRPVGWLAVLSLFC